MSILETDRLLLRPPGLDDVPTIVALIGDWDIVKNLSRAPYPYSEEHARQFVAKQMEGRAKSTDFAFAVTRKADGAYLGGCGVHLRDTAIELGYWLGKPFWRQGYASEAAGRVVAYAFDELRADRVWAGWFHDNPASGHVLAKLGFVSDGSEQHDCAARGHGVLCNLVTLDRARFAQRRAA